MSRLCLLRFPERDVTNERLILRQELVHVHDQVGHHGPAGQFNEVIVQHASNELEANQRKNWHCSVLCVGLRVFSRLEEAGQPVEQWVPLPGSVSAITNAVQDMVVRLEAWQTQKNIGRIVLFHNKPVSGASYEPQTIHLLPVDLNWFHALEQEPWPSRSLPQFTINWGSLFSSLVREYLFISIYQAFAKSLASENASRLTAMQVAEKNIDERLQLLNGNYHQLRQTTIDAELLDLIAGFEAMTK